MKWLGISLFIATNICESIIWKAFSPITINTGKHYTYYQLITFKNDLKLHKMYFFRISILNLQLGSHSGWPIHFLIGMIKFLVVKITTDNVCFVVKISRPRYRIRGRNYCTLPSPDHQERQSVGLARSTSTFLLIHRSIKSKFEISLISVN